MLIILHVEISLISKYKYIDLEMKEYYVPYCLLPQYNKECTELYFYFPCICFSEIKFENYYISNNRKPTTNYKSIHFIMGGKELTEEEIKNYTLDPNNEIIKSYKNNKDLFRAQYYVKVVLNGPVDTCINCIELILTDVIKSDKEMTFL